MPIKQTAAIEKFKAAKIKAYQKLSTDEQIILQVISLLHQSVNQTTLRQILAKCGFEPQQRKRLDRLVAKPLVDKLIHLELIIKKNNALMEHEHITDYVMRIAVTHPSFTTIAQAVEKTLPAPHPSSYWRYRNSPIRDPLHIRALRIFFYTHNTKQVLQLLGIKQPYTALDEKQSEPLMNLCADYNATDYEALPAPLQFQLLAPQLQANAITLHPVKQQYAIWEKCLGHHPEMAPAIACLTMTQRLLRGVWGDMESLLQPYDGSCDYWSFSGWWVALRGDYDIALGLFEQALSAKKKATRKRNICLEGLPALWFFLALLQSNDTAHIAMFNKQWIMADKYHPNDHVRRCLGKLAALANTLQGKMDASACAATMRDTHTDQPWELLFATLIQHWLGHTPPKSQRKALADYCEQAYRDGLLWFAYESAQLLVCLPHPPRSISHIATEAHQKERFAPLTHLIKPKAEWEIALTALESVAAPVSGHAGQASHQARMVWVIDHCPTQGNATLLRDFELEPREQRLGKNGTWSKGRAVSLKRLYTDTNDFDYLTTQDKALCRCIDYECHRSYRGYRSEYANLSGAKAAQAAIGHPLLFWDNDLNTPVELVQGQPTLTVEKKAKHLKLRLDPPPVWFDDEIEPYIVQKQGAYRLQIVVLNPQHQQIATILGKKGLTVPLAAEQQVLSSMGTIAPLLVVHSDITGGALTEAAKEVPADPRLHVHVQPAGDGLAMQLYVQPFVDGGPLFEPGQGGSAVFTEIGQEKLRAQRDLKQEQAACQTLVQACPTLVSHGNHPWRLEDTEEALEALCELHAYADSHPKDVMIAWPKGQTLQLSRHADVNQLQVSVRQNQDWFALSGQLKLDEKHIYSMEQLLDLVQTSPGRFIRLKDDQFLVLTEQLRKRLDAVRTYSDDGRFHTLASQALEDITDGMKLKSSKPWKARMQQLREAAALEPAIPSTLQAQLRDYQIEGFQWLRRLAHWGAGACLADDMGLGKTLQALTFILTQAPHGPTLILAPTSVCPNWQSEAQRFAPTLNVKRFGTGDRTQMLKQASAFDLVICSYGLLQTQGERLAEVNWQTIIADEAQAIKNPQAKRTQAAMALSASCKIATTGTPIENHLGELWSLFHFINPGLLGSLKRFNQRFAAAIENERDTEAGKQVTQQLKQLIRPFILRRLKSDVLQELPAKTEITLHVELSEEEQLLYESLRRQALKRLEEVDDNPGKQRVKVLAEIMRLRRACCHPKLVLPDSAISSAKLKTLNKILDELLDNRHKVLIFSQFVDHLSHIRELLDQRTIAYQYLDGSTPVKRREQAVNAFQAGEGDVFLISLKAGGAGLNLTAADYVIHMDPWWNPAVEDQASDRAHRIGQQRPVTIYRLVTTATIEEKIVELHQRKRHLADSLLEGNSSAGKLSVDDMMQLMGSI